MVFNSFEFIGFITVVCFITFLLNAKNWIKARNIFLLLVSWGFYGSFGWKFLSLLGIITIINYCTPILIETYSSKKKLILTMCILFSVGVLAFMKYAYIWNASILLPVGLSFFTFQALSYSIDTFRGKISVNHNFVNVALFISFLPTITSGPIERATNLFPQLNKKNIIDYNIIWSGIKLFIWGLFKKVVIADRLSLYINDVYTFPLSHTGSTLALTAVLYSIQIYCDFSGYADMAVGVGRVLGFKIMENFKFPYFSTSIKSFWKKWHISLTSWFTEYVYITLGGNRVVKWRWMLNILIVFILSGIWHGATIAFLIWGLMHGIAYLIEHFMGIKKGNIAYGFLCFIIISIAWIYFRIDNFTTASNIVSKIFTDFGSPLYMSINGSAFSFFLTMAVLLVFMIREYLTYKAKARYQFMVDIEASFLLILIAFLGISSNSFVYFQF